MAHEFYTALWQGAVADVSDLVETDRTLHEKPPYQSYKTAPQPIADLYVRYLQLVKKLDICYDQILQPQKRPLIRKLLDMSIGRMLELRDMMTQVEISPYVYFDKVLFEHQLTPFDVELSTPRYFRGEGGREVLLMEIRQRIDRIREEKGLNQKEMEEKNGEDAAQAKGETKAGAGSRESGGSEGGAGSLVEEARRKAAEKAAAERAEREGVDPVTGEMTRRGAIKMLQRHERARRARQTYAVLFEKHKEAMAKLKGQRVVRPTDDVLNAAATVMQKTWRGYRSRMKTHYRENRLLLALGMVAPAAFNTQLQEAAGRVDRLRHQLQVQNEMKMEERMAEEYARYMKVKAPWLREDLTDEIRLWFIDWYLKATDFPPSYPTEEEGGGLCIVAKQALTPEKFLQRKEKLLKEKELIKKGVKAETDKAMDKKALKAEKKRLKKEKKKKKKEMKRKIKAGERLVPYEFEPSNFVPELLEGQAEYNILWKGRDERDKPDEPLEMDLLRKEVAAECTREVRLQVDEFMRLELEVLKAALERDKSGKKKKGKKGGKKGNKGKKGKKGKKKGKPLTEEEVWATFDELVAEGIIKNYPQVYIKDFLGDFSYVTQELRRKLTLPDPTPGLGEMRQAVMETCILPLGSPEVHRLAPLIKSVCIAGLPQSGKHFLAHAVCTETGAIMFDMTPKAIANSSFGAKGGIKKFVKMAGDVARYIQPAVFFVDGAEKPFYKKIPKEEKPLKPRGVAKFLKKIVKMINPNERILMLGVTNQPWGAKKKMVKLFERWIVMPIPDYSTIVMTWYMELMKYYCVERQFHATPLAIETTNYSMENILGTLTEYLNLNRRCRLTWEPLASEELLRAMMKRDRYTPKDVDKLVKWNKKSIPSEKYRAKVLTNERIEAGLEEPKAKGKSKKKK